MDLIDLAVHQTLHNSDVKSDHISSMLGVSHQVLLNKANPDNDTHKLTLREATAMMMVTGNHRIFHAIGDQIKTSKPDYEQENVLVSVVKASAEHGDVVSVIHNALKDGKLTSKEKTKCIKEINEAISALEELRVSVTGHK